MKRGLWSPSRIKAALQCGRKLQGLEVLAAWVEVLEDSMPEGFDIDDVIGPVDRVLESESFAPTFAGCGICGFLPICRGEFQLTPIVFEEAS